MPCHVYGLQHVAFAAGLYMLGLLFIVNLNLIQMFPPYIYVCLYLQLYSNNINKKQAERAEQKTKISFSPEKTQSPAQPIIAFFALSCVNHIAQKTLDSRYR